MDMSASMETSIMIIHLNVGGKHLSTRLSTLRKYHDSMLAAMLSGRHKIDRDSDGRYFIDCNGDIFELVLDFLRFGSLPSKEKALVVYEMATYLTIEPLKQALESFLEVRNKIKVDAFKSSASSKEYESLKQKIIGALDSSRPLGTKRILLAGSTDCFKGCKLWKAKAALGRKLYAPADIMLEFNIDFQPSQDFIFCLTEDLYRYGFGPHCQAYTDHQICQDYSKKHTFWTIVLSSYKLVTSEQGMLKFI